MFVVRNVTSGTAMFWGGVGVCIAGFLAHYWLTQPILSASDLKVFSATVRDIREVSGDSNYLQITLGDEPYPFRSFDNAFRYDVKGPLQPGARALVGVAKSDVANPHQNWIQDRTFYEFLTLDVGGVHLLDLSVHNRDVENDRRFGGWLCLVIALIGSWLFWIGYSNRGSGRSLGEILKEKRKAKREMRTEPGE